MRSAFWKQSYQQMTCYLYKVMRIEDHYLVTLRRLRYPDGGYKGHMPDILESEEQPARSIHVTRIVRVHTDYLYDSPAYTRYQIFVRRLRQDEDEAGPQYVLQPVPEAHRDTSVRPEEPQPQAPVTVDPHVLRPRRSDTRTETTTDPYARVYKRVRRNR
jgi:hypothetical protein